jgi:hypothetical protein
LGGGREGKRGEMEFSLESKKKTIEALSLARVLSFFFASRRKSLNELPRFFLSTPRHRPCPDVESGVSAPVGGVRREGGASLWSASKKEKSSKEWEEARPPPSSPSL